MTHDELKLFKRGRELTWLGIRTVCLYTNMEKGGGVGMGEYPETFTAVFQSGLVLSSNPWVDGVSVVEHEL
jgi:hypothetical protein